MLLGCIADDLTGATDLALTLTQAGMRTVQSIGLPAADLDFAGFDAVVVALKSRSIPAAEAVDLSILAARRLSDLGASRLLFKYCSTFDSTDEGNIGPVLEALLAFTGGGQTIACPAFPRAGRTVYYGNLFVNGVPLGESPMRDHPLNPMHDSDLRRVLAQQTGLPVGLVGFEDVDSGASAIRAALAREAEAGRPVSIVDAVTDAHLRSIGTAIADLALVTGGSGIAMGLPGAYLASGLMPALTPPPATMASPPGRRAILAGSCSAMTLRQVETAIGAGLPSYRIDAGKLADGVLTVADVLGWLDRQHGEQTPLIYSSAMTDVIGATQARLGRENAGAMVEDLLAAVAVGLAARGYSGLIVAGGETSGAVVQALGATALAIGPEIAPGVPWTRTLGAPDLALALKSGNFGGADFFLKAWEHLS